MLFQSTGIYSLDLLCRFVWIQENYFWPPPTGRAGMGQDDSPQDDGSEPLSPEVASGKIQNYFRAQLSAVAQQLKAVLPFELQTLPCCHGFSLCTASNKVERSAGRHFLCQHGIQVQTEVGGFVWPATFCRDSRQYFIYSTE